MLISNGDKQDEETAGGRIRMSAVRSLCQMNPRQAFIVRAKCVSTTNVKANMFYLLGINVPMKTLFVSDNNFNHRIFLLQNSISSGWAWIVICITI